jgi:hypothetical protein
LFPGASSPPSDFGFSDSDFICYLYFGSYFFFQIAYLLTTHMVSFTATILKFGEKGEKSGWNYIEVPGDIAGQLKPGTKTAFRVKGRLDDFVIKGVSLIPMGGGDFIMALNATMRKGIRKSKGAMVKVQLTVDAPYEIIPELLECLSDEPHAMAFFKQLPRSHQNYFSKWIETAKTDATKAKRISQSVNAFLKQQGYGEMIRSLKKDKDDLRGSL